MTALKPANEDMTGAARFCDVIVEGCFVYRTSRWGIAVGYTYAHDKFQGAILDEKAFLKYGHEHKDSAGEYHFLLPCPLQQQQLLYDSSYKVHCTFLR